MMIEGTVIDIYKDDFNELLPYLERAYFDCTISFFETEEYIKVMIMRKRKSLDEGRILRIPQERDITIKNQYGVGNAYN